MNMSTNIEMQPCVELRRDEVARRTLRLWKAAGRPTGRDLEYWLQAEVELLSERQYCRSNWAPAVNGAAGKPMVASTRSAFVTGRNEFENLRSITVNAST
jgi:hypothetical protein